VENAYLLVTVRDINLLCQHFKTYAQIEGEKRRRRITKARRRKGILEVRTAARDEWIQNVTCIEWINSRGNLIQYMPQDIR
jgi:hypothetical protein